jgi:hypothetical protein
MSQERALDHANYRLRVLIAAYFEKPLAQLTDADLLTFETKFCGFCNTEENRKTRLLVRDVKRWFAKDDSVIFSDYQHSLVIFFQKKWEFFDHETLSHELSDFEANFYRTAAAHIRTLVIALGEPLGILNEVDRKFLCGVYELYRYSFANDGKINIDVLVVRPDPVNPNRLQMEVIVEAFREDGKHDRFVGIFCKYGNSLLGLPVFQHDDNLVDTEGMERKKPVNARVRRYEFPKSSLKRTEENLVKVGIVSGNSVQVECPVSAKCLIAKLSNDPERATHYLNIANRYRPEQLYQYYVEAISNDIRKDPKKIGDQDDYLLIARPFHPRLRKRQTFPPLPDDPADPTNMIWPNR